jgi:hypothetical protein
VIGDQFVGPLTLFRSESITVIEIPNLIASNPPEDLAAHVQKLVTERPGAIVVFIAGNVDLQIEIYRQVIFHPRSLSVTRANTNAVETSTLDADFNRYALRGVYRWCRWIRELELKTPVIVCGAILPTVADEYIAASLNQYLGYKRRPDRAAIVNKWVETHPSRIAITARAEFIKTWNGFLKAACTHPMRPGSRPLTYIDLNEDMLDEAGSIRAAYRHPTLINHTLLWEPTLDLWQARLELTDEDLREPRNQKYLQRKLVQLTHLKRNAVQ